MTALLLNLDDLCNVDLQDMRLVQHCRRLLGAMKAQRDTDPLLCDLTLQSVDGVDIRCHKAVLSANSEYFKTMLTSSFIESCQSVIKVQLNAAILQTIVDHFYDGSTQITVDNCLELLETADMLLASELRSECDKFVEDNLLEVLSCEATLNRDPETLRHVLPIINRQSRIKLKEVLAALQRWLDIDKEGRLCSYLEVQRSIVDSLRDEELTMKVPQEPIENEVFVNFQNLEQVYPNILKFDGEWRKCSWPTAEELPYNCEHFCIVEYGSKFLYCRSHGEAIYLKTSGHPEVFVEDTAGSLVSFRKSKTQIFLHKVSRTADRLKVFDRKGGVFRTLLLPEDFKLVKVCDSRIAEDTETNQIFLSATVRNVKNSSLQEGVFCFELDPRRPWVVEELSLLPHRSCDQDIPTVFGGLPVVLSTGEKRAIVHDRRDGQWLEKLSFPLVELDRSNYEIIYVYSSMRKLFLVVAQDQDVRVVCYADHYAAAARNVTEETKFPKARLDPECGVVFCEDDPGE